MARVEGGSKAAVIYEDGSREEADKVVVASGAWLSDLVREHEVTVPVQAGRGYSFSVATKEPIKHSVLLEPWSFVTRMIRWSHAAQSPLLKAPAWPLGH